MKAAAASADVLEHVLVDVSLYPNKAHYYAICPECQRTHGVYLGIQEAYRKRVCKDCSVDQINKIKKQIQQVIHEPEKKVKPLGDIVHEDELPVDDPDELDDPSEISATPTSDSWQHVQDLLKPESWVDDALRKLAIDQDLELEDLTIDPTVRSDDYDEDNPDATTSLHVEGPRHTYWILKDDEVARATAVKYLANNIDVDPGCVSENTLAQFIDDEELANAIGDPYEDFGYDEQCLDYEEKLEFLVDKDAVEPDDAFFFKQNGDARKETVIRERKLNQLLDDWIADNKPKLDPWEWLREMYGRDGAQTQALKLVTIDSTAVAEYVVKYDGWSAQFGEDRSTELDGGYIVITN